jgi:hypothetical protein
MLSAFEQRLSGGHPNSLGNTLQVVDEILKDKQKLEQLYQCYFSKDEIVRLRVSNAFKRICKEHPDWLVPYIDRFIEKISQIDQDSTQWTLAQLFFMLDTKLSEQQRQQAKKTLQHNLTHRNDWIVLNMTMETLTHWAKEDSTLKTWLIPHLKKLSTDSRTSVKKRAAKFLASCNSSFLM